MGVVNYQMERHITIDTGELLLRNTVNNFAGSWSDSSQRQERRSE